MYVCLIDWFRSFESMGVRIQNKDIIKIFDRMDSEGLGLLPHDELILQLFPSAGAAGSRRSSKADERADSDVRVALRKRPGLLEEIVSQMRTIDSQYK